MADSRIRLKNPWIAGLLAFLVPGLGHVYQGRLFKALIYFVCISGMFLTGARMADWHAIQAPPFQYRMKGRNLLMLKFAAQVGMGLPALGAMVQTRRYLSAENRPVKAIESSFSAPFEGRFTPFGPGARAPQRVTGTVTFEPQATRTGPIIGGRFEGVGEDGQAIQLTLEEAHLAQRIDSSRLRQVASKVNAEGGGAAGDLQGGIPRPLGDWLGVPLNDNEQRALEGRLGKWHELAMVLTWIAGLLNVLAIWDALEGPAYGYSDAESEKFAAVPVGR